MAYFFFVVTHPMSHLSKIMSLRRGGETSRNIVEKLVFEYLNIFPENIGESHSRFFHEFHWLTHFTMERFAGN